MAGPWRIAIFSSAISRFLYLNLQKRRTSILPVVKRLKIVHFRLGAGPPMRLSVANWDAHGQRGICGIGAAEGFQSSA